MSKKVNVYFDIEGSLIMTEPMWQFAALAVDENYEIIDSVNIKILIDDDKDLNIQKALEISHYDSSLWELEGIKKDLAIQKIDMFLRKHATQKVKYGSVAVGVGHNAITFDFPKLRAFFGPKFLPMGFLVKCTLQKSLWVIDALDLPKPSNYKLGTLCEHFGIKIEGKLHDALIDLKHTLELSRYLDYQMLGKPFQVRIL